MSRPSWDDTFFDILEIISHRSTCPRLHTAACLVDQHHRMIASGYNGSVGGLAHCSDDGVGCLMVDGHCVRTIHAELNTLLNAARTGTSTIGTTMYVLHTPCMGCAKAIAQAGIVAVKIHGPYDNASALDFLREAGVENGYH